MSTLHHIDGIEMIWVKALFNGQIIVFGVCYRPPNQSTNERSLSLSLSLSIEDGMYATFDTILRLSNTKFVLLNVKFGIRIIIEIVNWN